MALLPYVGHFVREGRKYFFIGAPGDGVRVHRQFVRGLLSVRPVKRSGAK
jgi:hypothetical protein